MERAKYKSAGSKLTFALVALFVCAEWRFPGHVGAQAAHDEPSAAQEVLVPLARGVLGQPHHDRAEHETGTIRPVVAARWTAVDEAQLWLSSVDTKLAGLALLFLVAGLFTLAFARRNGKIKSDIDAKGGDINRPSYV